MALQCGIIGITNVGKTTIFNCISPTKAEATSFAFSTNKSNLGIINVPDKRLYELEKFQPTERIVHATVEIVDIPGFAKNSNQGENVGFSDIRNTNALIHVLRCFDDDNLPHVDGSINPVRDIESFNLELQIRDLTSVEKKIQRFEKLIKVGDKDAKKGIEVLKVYKEHLESFQSAKSAPVNDEDKKYVDDLFLLSNKPVLYVCNVDEGSAINGNKYVDQVKEYLKNEETEILIVAGQLEADISELETEEERMEFLQEVGLTEPGVNKLVRSAYNMLNLQTFFTIGPKEIRAWTIKKGMTAPNAAGVIHSDLERGFIRAEVIKYSDFMELKSEQACKEKGKLSVEGKNYVVGDGDLLNIRFNV